ncbi:hypothetical protein N7478_005864 [Penicillium angulare]|uniref:uncharacterized protein n=1 Tax=Penicillium angulare TaxID=116970 RepID=UPI0025423634|nr:uncharacterized protein N7478_005864 [Penicillium angulare]KAJ5280492.1 hypothetical protein N7478_005864 [Penicillium angulare]
MIKMHHHITKTLGMIFLFTNIALANVEKTIFLAPHPSTVPSGQPDLDDLGLERLSPENAAIRTELNASFPSPETPEGTDSWFFLENLKPGQRYEVRVCYLSTQPTSFTLSTYPLEKTMDDTSLLSSLSIFSTARLATLDERLQENLILRQASVRSASSSSSPDTSITTDSVLFLRIRAAAEYFSHEKSLMETVPPVAVDLILDPFLWNVFPRSLVPTAWWVGVVALVAFLVARWIGGEIGRIIGGAREEKERELKSEAREDKKGK